MSIRFVTDSASDLDWDFAKEHGVQIVPLYVTIHNETFKEDENFDYFNFYKIFENTQVVKPKKGRFSFRMPRVSIPFISSSSNFFPKTSQPSPQDFLDAYHEIITEGAKDIIVVTISSGLSGTLNSARLAARQISRKNKEVKFYFVDSKSASYAEAFLVKNGLKCVEEGLEAPEIANKLQEEAHKISTYILLPTLKYLYHGGRISLSKYMLGRMLRKKPIVTTTGEGKIVAVDSVTDVTEGLKLLWKFTTADGTRIPKAAAVMYASRADYGEFVAKLIKEKNPEVELILDQTGAVIPSHLGAEAVGLVSLFDEKVK